MIFQGHIYEFEEQLNLDMIYISFITKFKELINSTERSADNDQNLKITGRSKNERRLNILRSGTKENSVDCKGNSTETENNKTFHIYENELKILSEPIVDKDDIFKGLTNLVKRTEMNENDKNTLFAKDLIRNIKHNIIPNKIMNEIHFPSLHSGELSIASRSANVRRFSKFAGAEQM